MYIAKFILSVKKKRLGGKSNQNEDDDYEPETLTAFHFSIQRHFAFKGYKINIKSQDVFKHSRTVSLSKKYLKKKGKGTEHTLRKHSLEMTSTCFGANVFFDQVSHLIIFYIHN